MARRLNAVFLFFFIIFSIIIFKLFQWQVLSYDKLGGLAERQRQITIEIPAKRGKILASDGSPIVINQKAYGVYIEPKKIKDKNSLITLLSRELNIPVSTISAKLDNEKLLWIPIAHKIDQNIADRIKNSKLDGLDFLEESKRYYPESSMAAHLLGFVGKNSQGNDQGYFGLEGYYDEQLRGRNGQITQENDATGNPILTGNLDTVPAENGRDLNLYIDKTVQYVIEDKLKSGIEKYEAKGGTAIVMDPQNGGIIGLAAYPSYDQGNYPDYPEIYYKNPAISSSYEPGSTFKTLIMAMALDNDKVKPDTKFNESGPVDIGGYTINTWNQKYHGEITMTQILEYSSNVGMVFVERQLDKEIMLNYLHNLGIGEMTEIDLQDEATPLLRPSNKWYEIDYATASFGQGIALTPLQMVRAVAALANGGKLMRPEVVKSIRLSDGKLIETEPKVVKQIYKKESTKIITEMMVSAVDNGEAKFTKPKGYRIAGKTGTAQIAISGHYDSEKTIASFVGFAPADSPRFVILVTLKEPSKSIWGSETAAPIFFQIAKELFTYYGISPSE